MHTTLSSHIWDKNQRISYHTNSKKKKGTLNYVPQKRNTKKQERTYLSSFRDRSSVRPGPVSKKEGFLFKKKFF